MKKICTLCVAYGILFSLTTHAAMEVYQGPGTLSTSTGEADVPCSVVSFEFEVTASTVTLVSSATCGDFELKETPVTYVIGENGFLYLTPDNRMGRYLPGKVLAMDSLSDGGFTLHSMSARLENLAFGKITYERHIMKEGGQQVILAHLKKVAAKATNNTKK